MNTDDALILTSAEADVHILLQGGCMGRYRLLTGDEPFDLMRPLVAARDGVLDPLAVASFPLVPYFSRIRNGRFRFGDATHQLTLNVADHPHSLHGIGWQECWHEVEIDQCRAVIALDYDGPDWPFPFRAAQTFTLAGAELCHEISLTNNGDVPMPAGLGVHPFFPRHDGAMLRADVEYAWRYDDNFLPTQRIACPPVWNLSENKNVGTLDCDTVFEGWNGSAVISWPEKGATLHLDADAGLDRLCVYAVAGADFFCVEPVSHITDAFNMSADGMPMAETGMRHLVPGETWSQRVWFRPE